MMLRLATLMLLVTACNATLSAASVALSEAVQYYSGPQGLGPMVGGNETRFVDSNTETPRIFSTNATNDEETRFNTTNTETSVSALTEIKTRSMKENTVMSKDFHVKKETHFVKRNVETHLKGPIDSPASDEIRFPRVPTSSPLRKVPTLSDFKRFQLQAPNRTTRYGREQQGASRGE